MTRDVYGYVVARDSDGLIQIIPIHAAIAQIQRVMNATNISMLQSIDSGLESWGINLVLDTSQDHSPAQTVRCKGEAEIQAVVSQPIRTENIRQPDINYTTSIPLDLKSSSFAGSPVVTISQSYEETPRDHSDNLASSSPGMEQMQVVEPVSIKQDQSTLAVSGSDIEMCENSVLNILDAQKTTTNNDQNSQKSTRDTPFQTLELHEEHSKTKAPCRLETNLDKMAVESMTPQPALTKDAYLTSANLKKASSLLHTSQTVPYHTFSEVPSSLPFQSEYTSTNYERPSAAWSTKEDNKLMQLRTQGMNWGPIATYLPGKTPNACRKRHERLMEKKNAESWDDGIRIEDLSRAYLQVREQMWKILAETLGEKWQTVETKVSSRSA